MKRIFTFALGALAMLAVALISAFIAMRLAIHGREAVVPTLTGMTVSEASDAAGKQGLRLTLENRFYSSGVGRGRVLAQDPSPGSRVRREWPIRITESLGPQQVNIPDLAGESEREASVNIRRLSLELGSVVHFGVPGEPDVVLAQTPMPNSGTADSPRVSLLVSDSTAVLPNAYVMPSLLGLSVYSASIRAASAGLRLEVTPESEPVPSAGSPGMAPQPAVQQPTTAPEPPSGTVVVQSPPPGRRVQQGDVVHVELGRPEVSGPVPPAQ